MCMSPFTVFGHEMKRPMKSNKSRLVTFLFVVKHCCCNSSYQSLGQDCSFSRLVGRSDFVFCFLRGYKQSECLKNKS